MRTEEEDKCIFVWEEIIRNSCGPTGINLNLAQNISESLPKFHLPASCDIYNSDLFLDYTHTHKGFFPFATNGKKEAMKERKKN